MSEPNSQLFSSDARRQQIEAARRQVAELPSAFTPEKNEVVKKVLKQKTYLDMSFARGSAEIHPNNILTVHCNLQFE